MVHGCGARVEGYIICISSLVLRVLSTAVCTKATSHIHRAQQFSRMSHPIVHVLLLLFLAICPRVQDDTSSKRVYELTDAL
jgi:hypothetical protein